MVKEADFIQQAVAEAKLFFSFASATVIYKQKAKYLTGKI
jgi:hypothetical protein